jgi:hypothetical protein
MPHLRVHARAASRSPRERSIEKSSAMVSTCRADLVARDRAHVVQLIDSEITRHPQDPGRERDAEPLVSAKREW